MPSVVLRSVVEGLFPAIVLLREPQRSVLQRWSDLALLQTVVLGLEGNVMAMAMKLAWMVSVRRSR
jgi:hypothetical protein